MAQVQCPNCGGYMVEGERVDADPKTGRKIGDSSCTSWIVAGVVAMVAWVLTYRLVIAPLREQNNNTTATLVLYGFIIFSALVLYFVVAGSANARKAKLARAITTYHYHCQICGYRWSLREGDPAPPVTVRPDLIAQGSVKFRAAACKVCGQHVPENVRTCHHCGTARW